MAPSNVHVAKRAKFEAETPEKNDKNTLPFGFKACQALLATSPASPMPSMPSTLLCIKTKNDLDKMRTLFDKHGFRTSVVHSPRAALSVYLDSCNLSSSDEAFIAGKEFLLTMLGMHPRQNDMERWYVESVKKVYSLMLFCDLCRKLCPQAAQNDAVSTLLTENETRCRSLGVVCTTVLDDAHKVSTTVSERVAGLVKAIVDADSRIRAEQLQHEFDRITFRNSTMANAAVQLFLDAHSCCIKEVYFKRSHLEKYQRITLYLYDPEVDELKPPAFTFLPSLHRALESGPEVLVQDMIRSFWGHLLRHGYFATPAIKSEFTPDLEKYFLSGITQSLNIPLLL
jgi:Pyruvate/2-oxoacid:ferredoxin oxidoreductase delta subunit